MPTVANPCSCVYHPLRARIQATPFADEESLAAICFRCSAPIPLQPTAGGEACAHCKQPFVFSMFSFEALPVVEFVLEDGIAADEAARLIGDDSRVAAKVRLVCRPWGRACACAHRLFRAHRTAAALRS